MLRKIILGLIAVLILIQVIRPGRNESTAASPNDITTAYPVPEQVQTILKTSCYNCHSNSTNYPWYANIQPVGWWMQKHVNDAKKELNFSEFGTYAEKKAKHKFDEMVDEVSEGEMPLKSYLIMHAEAKMTPEQSKALTDWAEALK